MFLEKLPKGIEMIGMLWLLIGGSAVFFLMITKRFKPIHRFIFKAISVIFGFLIFSPMLVVRFHELIARDTGAFDVPVKIIMVIILLTIILLTAFFGRIFCGFFCPVGAIQDLLFRIPVKKININNKKLPIIINAVSLIIYGVVGFFFSVNIVKYLGISDFFMLNVVSISFFIFAGILINSIFFYRPFCRFLCGYGFLLSLASMKSYFRIRAKKECQPSCPTGVFKMDKKGVCFLCGKCTLQCKDPSAVYYGK